MNKHPAPGHCGLEQDLADLRYTWGGAYRITWQNHFLATHIASGETVGADTAAGLHAGLRDHFRQTRNVKDDQFC